MDDWIVMFGKSWKSKKGAGGLARGGPTEDDCGEGANVHLLTSWHPSKHAITTMNTRYTYF